MNRSRTFTYGGQLRAKSRHAESPFNMVPEWARIAAVLDEILVLIAEVRNGDVQVPRDI
jgi:hypothetical protein